MYRQAATSQGCEDKIATQVVILRAARSFALHLARWKDATRTFFNSQLTACGLQPTPTSPGRGAIRSFFCELRGAVCGDGSPESPPRERVSASSQRARANSADRAIWAGSSETGLPADINSLGRSTSIRRRTTQLAPPRPCPAPPQFSHSFLRETTTMIQRTLLAAFVVTASIPLATASATLT